jgi:hypothetical protein
MSPSPDWRKETRFYVPNEDADAARLALACLRGGLGRAPRRPVFVTGSGMLALDLLPELDEGCEAQCIDLSPFQQAWMARVMVAVEAASSPADLQDWLGGEVLAEMNAFYAARGRAYTLEGVLDALRRFFHIRFFFEGDWLCRVRERLGMVRNIQGDMVERVQQGEFDFAHFSNIVDYLPEASLHRLFGACAAEGAPCFFIETTACPDREALARAWLTAGMRLHPASERLSASNCALGCRTSVRHWMRTGAVSLLLPASLTDNPRG